MGCGASAHAAPTKEQTSPTAEAEGTWATKTSAPSKDVTTDQVQAFQAPKAGDLAKKEQTAVTVTALDAEEDDDGVEIIYETQPKWQASQQPAAANGQEPPEAAEVEVRRPEPKPLPKQQQEEAAKLAETRKRFDNHRYQNQQRSASTDTCGTERASPVPFDMPGAVQGPEPQQARPTDAAAATSVPPARDASGPKTDMMLGLNVTETTKEREGSLDLAFSGLPGGIFDELEDLQQPIKETKNRENQHDEVKSNGFDDDDEMLMREILENFDA